MSADEMRIKVEDYDLESDSGVDFTYDDNDPDCDFCDDRGCEECRPDDFAQMHLKWVCDGSGTIHEAVEALQEFIKDLKDYESDGFDLSEPVDNAYFWMERKLSFLEIHILHRTVILPEVTKLFFKFSNLVISIS